MDLLLVATSALGVDSRTHLPKISTFSQCSTAQKQNALSGLAQSAGGADVQSF